MERGNIRERKVGLLWFQQAAWGSRSEPTVYPAVLFHLSVPEVTAQEPRAFLTEFPFISQWETEAQGGAGTRLHRPTHCATYWDQTQSYLF